MASKLFAPTKLGKFIQQNTISSFKTSTEQERSKIDVILEPTYICEYKNTEVHFQTTISLTFKMHF